MAFLFVLDSLELVINFYSNNCLVDFWRHCKGFQVYQVVIGSTLALNLDKYHEKKNWWFDGYHTNYHGDWAKEVFIIPCEVSESVLESPKSDLISFLMYQIFVQTIFELQIAFNGIKFHISAFLTKDEHESIIMDQRVSRAGNEWVERFNRLWPSINYLKTQKLVKTVGPFSHSKAHSISLCKWLKSLKRVKHIKTSAQEDNEKWRPRTIHNFLDKRSKKKAITKTLQGTCEY